MVRISLAVLSLSFFLLLCVLSLAGEESPESKQLIARMWHGRTELKKADEYLQYINEAGIKKIKSIPGNQGVQLFRRVKGDTVEFVVISYWDSIDAIKRFAGEDYEKTHHLPKDPEYLLELEPFVQHYNVVLNDWK